MRELNTVEVEDVNGGFVMATCAVLTLFLAAGTAGYFYGGDQGGDCCCC